MRAASSIDRRHFIQVCAAVGLSTASAHAIPPQKEKGWQIGCFTRPWAEFSVETIFDAIAKAGFHYVGLMSAAPDSQLILSVSSKEEKAVQIGSEAKSRGLSILSIFSGDFGVEQSLQSGIEGLRQLIDLSVACGSKSLLLGGTDKPELFDVYYQAVAKCCDEAMKKKIQLTIKPHGGLNSTGPQCRKIVEKVGHRNFRLWYDPGNIFYYSDGQLDPVQDVESVDGIVTGMCVKDYQHPKNVEITPGTGKVNFPVVISRLKKGGFKSGPMLIECLKKGDLESLQREAVRARQSLESWL
jgi:sugar phosphate isomerase/epimerase